MPFKKKAKRKAKASKVKKKKRAKSSRPETNPSGGGTKLKRSPVALSSFENAAELGHVLDIEADGKILSWPERKKPKMLYSPSSKTLWWFYGPVKETKAQTNTGDNKTSRLYKTWTDDRRNARSTKSVADIPDRIFQTVHRIGNAAEIGYRSDKFDARGKSADYKHDFGKGVNLYRFGGTKPPWVFAVRGGNMRVTRRGIEG